MTASKAVKRIFRGMISEENQRRTSRPTYCANIANVTAVKFFGRRERRAPQILLDPGCGMNRLSDDLFLVLAHIGMTSIDRNDNYRNDNLKEGELSATEQSGRSVDIRSFYGLTPVMVLLAGILSGCGESKPPQAAAAAPPVTVAQPVKRTVTDWDEFTGRFDAVEQVQIRARVGGFITAVEFRDGAFVNAGDLLYLIDARPFEAVAAQADGQLSDARAKVELAKRELDRALTLQQSQNVADNVVDQRRQALQAARAAQTQAEGLLKAAQLNVEFTHVAAPIGGRASRHLVSVGNLVQGSEGGSTLLTSIVSLDPIYIYFDIDEATYLKYNRLWFEGKRPSSRDNPNPVEVMLTGETKPSHNGTVNFLDNQLDVSTGTLRGRAVIANKDLSILPGQFGRVRLIASAPYEALLVPDGAIATDQARKIVFVVKDDNTVEAKPVTLGPLDEGLRVVREGLKPEDRVIVDGLQRARVGAKVTPHEVKPASAGGKT
jgi:membrane fusion protein, multidrug efflux system